MNKEFQSYLLIAINNKSRENNKGKLCMQIKKKKSVCNYTSKTDRHDITEIVFKHHKSNQAKPIIIYKDTLLITYLL